MISAQPAHFAGAFHRSRFGEVVSRSLRPKAVAKETTEPWTWVTYGEGLTGAISGTENGIKSNLSCALLLECVPASVLLTLLAPAPPSVLSSTRS
jgi:hypothetical protein